MENKQLHRIAEASVWLRDLIPELECIEWLISTTVEEELSKMTVDEFKKAYFYNYYENGIKPTKKSREYYEILKTRFYDMKKK